MGVNIKTQGFLKLIDFILTTKRYLNVTDKHLHEIVDLVGFADKIEKGRFCRLKRGDYFCLNL